MEYTSYMVKIRRTAEFDNWLDSLKDRLAKSSVQARIDRMAKGNAGDVKPVGEGVREQEFTKIPLMNFTLSNQNQPIPHLASPLKGEELSPFPFKGKVRINQRLGCGLLQPSRMASCFIEGMG